MKKVLTRYMKVAMLVVTPMVATAGEVSINGFLTAGVSKSDSETTYLGGINDKASFEPDTVLGLQFVSQINDTVGFTAQLLGTGADTFNLTADWAYVSFALSDELSVKAGRVKLPMFLVSDYVEVGAAYPWIRPPEEVYAIMPITAANGLDARYEAQVGEMDLVIQPYVGTLLETVTVATGDLDIAIKDLTGLRATLGNDNLTLSLGSMRFSLDIPAAGVDDETTELWTAGVKFEMDNIIMMSEYSEREVPGLQPDYEGWYVMGGYRFGNFLPHLTIAAIDTADVTVAAGKQQSTTLGLNYQFDPSTVLKLEWKSIEVQDDTLGLFSGPPSDDKAQIISASVDIIF